MEYARSGTPMGSHWGRHPLTRSLCSFNWTQNRIADRVQVNRNDLYRWQIITHLSSPGTVSTFVTRKGLCSPLVDDRKDFPSLAGAQCLSAYGSFLRFSLFLGFLLFAFQFPDGSSFVKGTRFRISLSLFFCNSVRLVLSENRWLLLEVLSDSITRIIWILNCSLRAKHYIIL